MPRNLAVHLRDKDAKDSVQQAREADAYVLHCRGNAYWKRIPDANKARAQSRSHEAQGQSAKSRLRDAAAQRSEVVCYRCNQAGHKSRACLVTTTQNVTSDKVDEKTGEKKCFSCKQFGHMKSACPNRPGSDNVNGATKKVYKCQSQVWNGDMNHEIES